ncbi:hypothetical protein D910_02153 [Dendroctonus ponderosae]|uniref:Uncharacterized protein n=1 Tax=Dendroctonus ponderosae TaxID=77166 RepID=U4TXK0_DENPD|nr:hypothetical protein D910_02153 [Dendroctonus ponderosae]
MKPSWTDRLNTCNSLVKLLGEMQNFLMLPERENFVSHFHQIFDYFGQDFHRFLGKQPSSYATFYTYRLVQQASLSLDHANITSTILLKNGNDFLGNVHTVQEANAAKLAALKSQKEENMKQLLDVANNLTLEEIHDFEMSGC